MKHDRSIINARGGRWPALADALRAQAEAIATTGRSLPQPPATAECDLLAKRREALGLTPKEFGKLAKLSYQAVYTVEVGASGAEALQRYRDAIAHLEKEALESASSTKEF